MTSQGAMKILNFELKSIDIYFIRYPRSDNCLNVVNLCKELRLQSLYMGHNIQLQSVTFLLEPFINLCNI